MNWPDHIPTAIRLLLPVARRPSSLSLWSVHSLETSKPRAPYCNQSDQRTRAEPLAICASAPAQAPVRVILLER
jgi:hypothetical protein